MARRRSWETLSESTRKRYLSKGRSLGQSAAEVIRLYESGGNMSAHRGHPSRAGGVSERMWTRLRAAARRARLQQDGDVSDILESLLGKGFKPQWILDKLDEKEESRDAYRNPFNRMLRNAGQRNAGIQPGNDRYHQRIQYADIELFYYH